MLKKVLLFPAFLFAETVPAQNLRMPVSITYTQLTAYSRQFSDAFSFTGNLGTLGKQQLFAAGVYSERRFLLEALSSYSATIVLPTTSGNFGWNGEYAGRQLYNESTLGLAYARELGSKVSLGVQFNYHSLQAAGYGSASTLSFDAGALFHIAPQLSAGMQVVNPIGASWSKEAAERLPAVYSAGLGYDVSEQVFVGVEAEKTEDIPVSINAGFHYGIAKKFIARAGIRSAAATYYLGFGVQLSRFRLDVTASVHPYLGVTPGLLLLYASKE